MYRRALKRCVSRIANPNPSHRHRAKPVFVDPVETFELSGCGVRAKCRIPVSCTSILHRSFSRTAPKDTERPPRCFFTALSTRFVSYLAESLRGRQGLDVAGAVVDPTRNVRSRPSASCRNSSPHLFKGTPAHRNSGSSFPSPRIHAGDFDKIVQK